MSAPLGQTTVPSSESVMAWLKNLSGSARGAKDPAPLPGASPPRLRRRSRTAIGGGGGGGGDYYCDDADDLDHDLILRKRQIRRERLVSVHPERVTRATLALAVGRAACSVGRAWRYLPATGPDYRRWTTEMVVLCRCCADPSSAKERS